MYVILVSYQTRICHEAELRSWAEFRERVWHQSFIFLENQHLKSQHLLELEHQTFTLEIN